MPRTVLWRIWNALGGIRKWIPDPARWKKEKTNKCEIKFLEILKELNGLDEQHKQELFQRCFRDTCLTASVS